MTDTSLKALLIEDDAEDTLLLTEFLAQPGWPSLKFTLITAESLKAGLAHLQEGGIDVVLLDLMLPDSQGVDGVKQILSRFPLVPVVVLTGMRDEATGLDAVRLGAQDFVVKGSMEGKNLRRIINFAVERHRLASSFEALIKDSADGMVVVDGRGVVRYVNRSAQAFFGWQPGEYIAKIFPFPLPSTNAGELRVLGDEGERIAEARITSVQWRSEAARLVSIRDITNLRRIEQLKAEVKERRRVDQLKDELVGTVSHEIRSPLTIIKAAVDNLRHGLAGPLSEPQKTMIQLAHNNTQRLMKVLNNILDLSRLESGKAQIQARSFDSREIIEDAAVGFEMLAKDRGIELELKFPDRLPAVYADPDLFLQALGNLIDNGLRFAKSKISIEASEIDDGGPQGPRETAPGGSAVLKKKYVQYCISNDGPAIPKERLGDLFDKFVQLRRRTAEPSGYKGTGLGLSICREIVERQKGRIWVESGKSDGTRFYFTLPERESRDRDEGGANAAKRES